MRRPWALAAGLFLALGVQTAWAGWASLGRVPAPTREERGLRFQNEQGVVTVTTLGPEIVRVRFTPGGPPPRDHSYAVMDRGPWGPAPTLDVQADRSSLATSALRVTIRHDPFRVAFANAAGESLDEDDPDRGMAFVGKTTRVWKRLRDDEHVYGFGEKNGRLDKRGRLLGGYSYTMWNSDTFGYSADTDPIYASVPFFLVMRDGGRTHGIYYDNTFRSTFDVGRESRHLLSFGAEDGGLDYYFILGPTPKEVVQRYTQLTGRMPLPPRWALGFHQCRYSYYPESRVRFIADNFRLRRIPADVLWLDIHYLDNYKPFTWDRTRFPDPKRLIRDLRGQGFRTVIIVDPHPKREPGHFVYDTGLAGGHFVKNPDGSVYEGKVWPGNAEKDPGPSVFPDFSKPAARDWWGGLFKGHLDEGVAGIWNDMNEPAVFDYPSGTMPLDVVHDNEGRPTTHREIHNVYGLLNSRATHEGLARLRPGERPFVLTRATFAGGQRWSALWPGDNVSDWTAFKDTIPMFAGLGLSGFTFVGADIGGFAEAPTAELFTRWLQAGVFYPFMRVHTTFGTPDQEPWSYGPRHEELNRRAIELRYELLPQIYNVMQESSVTGLPAFRPMLLEYPDDPATYQMDDQFLFGRDLLVAPVLRAEVTERGVYLPRGTWYDFWTGKRYDGGKGYRVPVSLDAIPIFVRGGAVIFRQPVVQHTGEMAGQPLRALLHAQESADGTLYEDDGETPAHRQGAFLRRRFVLERDGQGVRVSVSAPEGAYRPASRDLVLEVRGLPGTSAVTVGAEALPAVALEAFPGAPKGWARDADGLLRVKLPDRFAAFTVAIRP
jgi:alpha-glucosidase